MDVFVKYATSIFENIDNEIKKKIKYEDEEVHELVKICFVVANTGNVALSKLNKPMIFHYPDESEVVDVYIRDDYYRDVKYCFNDDENSIEFRFDLLNPGESFEFELLIKSDLSEIDNKENYFLKILSNYSFCIIKEYFSKNIPISELKLEDASNKENKVIVLISIFSALIFGISFFGYSLVSSNSYNFFSNDFFIHFSSIKAFILLSWVIIIINVLLTLIFLTDIILKEIYQRKTKKYIVKK